MGMTSQPVRTCARHQQRHAAPFRGGAARSGRGMSQPLGLSLITVRKECLGQPRRLLLARSLGRSGKKLMSASSVISCHPLLNRPNQIPANSTGGKYCEYCRVYTSLLCAILPFLPPSVGGCSWICIADALFAPSVVACHNLSCSCGNLRVTQAVKNTLCTLAPPSHCPYHTLLAQRRRGASRSCRWEVLAYVPRYRGGTHPGVGERG